MPKKAAPELKIGGTMKVWWNTGKVIDSNNVATILDIMPYRGHFPESFDCVLKLNANNGYGSLEMAYKKSDYRHDHVAD